MATAVALNGRDQYVLLPRLITGALTLFVDGAQVSAGRGGTQRLASAPGLRSGVLQSGRNFLAGNVADLAVYNSALPPATVTAHFRARS